MLNLQICQMRIITYIRIPGRYVCYKYTVLGACILRILAVDLCILLHSVMVKSVPNTPHTGLLLSKHVSDEYL